jgi:peptide/nickel transport system substrate-binding protein
MVIVLAALASGALSSVRSEAAPTKTIASFTYGIPTALGSLDLTRNMNGWASAVDVMVTEPLERIDSSGKSTLVLAQSIRHPNAKTVVYQLKKGVKFSDGKPLTSADVKWAFDHATAGSEGAQTASILTSIASVSVSGPLQVTVHLSHPDPAIRGSVAFAVQIGQKAAALRAGKDYGTANGLPIGTGPYVFSAFTASSVTETRNPRYRGPAPAVSKLVFASFADDSSAQLALRSGSIQANYLSEPKNAPAWRNISGTYVYATPSLLSTYLTMDTTTAPFNDVHVRRAIAYLTDRVGLARAAYGNYGAVMQSIVPNGEVSSLAPSKKAFVKFNNSLPQYDFSIAKAKAELAQSNVPNGFSVEVPYPTSEAFAEPTLLSLQQNAKQIGINITLKPQTFLQWATDIYTFKVSPLGVFEIGDLQPDPNGGLGTMVGKTNAVPTHFNMARWSTPAIEKAFVQMTQSSNKAIRWAATKTILSAAAVQEPYVPLYVPYVVLAYGKGYKSTSVPDFMSFINGAWLAKLTTTG